MQWPGMPQTARGENLRQSSLSSKRQAKLRQSKHMTCSTRSAEDRKKVARRTRSPRAYALSRLQKLVYPICSELSTVHTRVFCRKMCCKNSESRETRRGDYTGKVKFSSQDGRYRDLMGEKAAKYTKGILCAYRKIKKSLSKTGEGFLYRCTIIPITPFKKTMRSDKDTSGTPETIRTSDPSLRSMAYHVIHGSDVTSNIILYAE